MHSNGFILYECNKVWELVIKCGFFSPMWLFSGCMCIQTPVIHLTAHYIKSYVD